MATGDHTPGPLNEEAWHRQLIWEEFCHRATEVGNKAIEYFDLADLDDDLDEEEVTAIYEYRWASTGDVIVAAYNFLWPEIESLAIKLGVPFQPEIGEIDGFKDE